MDKQLISKDVLSKMLKELAKNKTVIAPVQNGKVLEYMPISDDTEIVLSDELPYKSPKDCFFPQVEKLLTFSSGEVEAHMSEEGRILFGVKPCDAEALRVLHEVFMTGQFQDPFFQNHFDNSLIISVGCIDEKPGCFCAQRGLDKTYTDFCDILLNPAGEDAYSVEYVSDKGRELLDQFDETKGITVPEGRTAATLDPSVKQVELSKDLDEAIFFDEENVLFDWGKATEICQGCGICTFICPTCHCFDLRDVEENGEIARYRCWDSCVFPKFTLHASGHNPRMSKKERYRQRVLHKYLYVNKNFGYTACTGCGRCIRSCPVGMNIKRIVEGVMEVLP